MLMRLKDDLRWQDHAACLGVNGDLFYPERGGSSTEAKAICAICPVQSPCLAAALARNEQFGIFGGTSERERRAMRKLPVVTRKICSDCRKALPVSEFHADASHVNGVRSRCKSCTRIRVAGQSGSKDLEAVAALARLQARETAAARRARTA